MSAGEFDAVAIGGGQVYICGDHHLLPDQNFSALRSLTGRLNPGDTLLFLGDLFEIWYENTSGHVPGYADFLDFLHGLSSRGVLIRMVLGNRDFMAGAQLIKHTGMSLHARPLLLRSSKGALLAIHGDELLPTDTGYQRFKAWSRQPIVLWILRHLPLALLARLAGDVRRKSKMKLASMAQDAFIPDATGLAGLVAASGAAGVVAGHLHRTLYLPLSRENGAKTCTVMPDCQHNQIHYRVWDGARLSDLQVLEK